jgi:fimbrial chaperone protein
MHQKPYRTHCRPPVVWFVLATLLGVLAAGGAHAQSLEVAPVRIEMPPGKTTTTIVVTNRGKQTTAIQVRAYAWSQSNNTDQLEPTKDVLVSPPIADVQAGQTQLIRVLLRKPAGAMEDTYRLLVDQIPPVGSDSGIRIALRLSLPIFVSPARKAASDLEWRLVSSDGAEAELIARNRGARHVRLANLSLAGPPGTQLQLPSIAAFYVLPGAERRWRVTGKMTGLRPGASLRLTGASDEGRIEAAPVFATTP